MDIETTVNPGISYRGHALSSTDASLVAKLTPAAAVQLGVKVGLQLANPLWDGTLETHEGDNLRNNICKTDRNLIHSPFPFPNHSKLNTGVCQYFSHFFK